MTGVRKALVVDDDPEVREALRGILERDGWDVMDAENGEMGVTAAVLHLPDLIVLDVMMPIKYGFAAFAELRADPRCGHIPVIMLTSVNDYELGARHDAGSIGRKHKVRPPEAFLEKPVDSAAFRTALNEALED